MGSQNFFKTIISLKREKDRNAKQVKGSSTSEKSNGFKWKNQPWKSSTSFANGSTGGNSSTLGMPIEDLAAIRIQTAFRSYKARKSLRRLKGMASLQTVVQTYSIKKQATSMLNHLHSWSNMQFQIRARRLSMVMEGRLRQNKMEDQLKLEAKLHDLEVEWSGGPETKEEILTRIHLRENAAVKRERAMAYAFSHQWRANSNYNGLNNYELANANWGWSWLERWIAARPWESRVHHIHQPKKVTSQQASKVTEYSNSPSGKASVPVKASLSNGKGIARARKLSFPDAKKQGVQESAKDEMNNKKEKEVDNMV